MSDGQHALGQFRLARRILATHPGDVKDRLWYAQAVALTLIDRDELPSHLREDFAWVQDQLAAARHSEPGDATRAALDGIRTTTAKKIAEKVYDLCELFEQKGMRE